MSQPTKTIQYAWQSGDGGHSFDMVQVEGTHGRPFRFGEDPDGPAVDLADFLISTTPVTQALWIHIMGSRASPSHHRGNQKPIENISWDELTAPDGFLERISTRVLPIQPQDGPVNHTGAFRLPTETEWEYAARGGKHWPDQLRFSGSNNLDVVGWYLENSGNQTHEVGQKAANRLGLYDMCGNVWEWCQDSFTRNVAQIPSDGTPFVGASQERVLRGGCFHNGANHCTVFKRYEIAREYHDECIGFRLALSLNRPRDQSSGL